MAETLSNPLNENDISHLKSKLNGESGSYACTDANAFDSVLERHGTSHEEVDRVMAARDEAIQMVAGAAAEQGLSDMESDKSLDKVTASARFNRDEIKATFTRSREVPNQDKTTRTSYGILTVGYTAKGQKGTSQPLAGAKQYYADKARQMLAD